MANLSITRLSSNVTGTIANALPKMSVAGKKSNKAIAWIGKNISSPQNHGRSQAAPPGRCPVPYPPWPG